MSLIVLLDADPLGMLTNPKSSPENEACKNWLASLACNGVEVYVPRGQVGCGMAPLAYGDVETAREVLSLPIYPELSDEDVDYVVAQVRAFSASYGA